MTTTDTSRAKAVATTRVPLEIVNGSIGGVRFGATAKVLARSPKALLLWVPGDNYSSGGRQTYGRATLCLVTDRNRLGSFSSYRTLHRGGRLSANLLGEYSGPIAEAFGPLAHLAISPGRSAPWMTVLFDGGGPALTPARPSIPRPPPLPRRPSFAERKAAAWMTPAEWAAYLSGKSPEEAANAILDALAMYAPVSRPQRDVDCLANALRGLAGPMPKQE
jgi:hypothetical protein